MTREESARKNSRDRELKSKQLVVSAITGLYRDTFKKPSGRWDIRALADFTHLHRDTVSKHIKRFEEELTSN